MCIRDRYAYLRSRDLDTIKSGGIFAGQTPDNLVLNGKDLDDAIDDAMLAAPVQPVQSPTKPVNKPMYCGSSHCSCIECGWKTK